MYLLLFLSFTCISLGELTNYNFYGPICHHSRDEISKGPVEVNSSAIHYFYSGKVKELANEFQAAAEFYGRSISINPCHFSTWRQLIRVKMTHLSNFTEAVALLETALLYFPRSHELYHLLGLCKQYQHHLNEAVTYFHLALSIEPSSYLSKTSLAAVYQVLGMASEALRLYISALPFPKNDATTRNNYGALLGVMGRKDEEVYWLMEALHIEPNMSHALINLAGFYQDEGYLSEARSLIDRAAVTLKEKMTILRIRNDLMMHPVCLSWRQMIDSREDIELKLLKFISISHVRTVSKNELDASLDRIHFYVAYQGLNDRFFQELVVSTYHIGIKDLEIVSPIHPMLNLRSNELKSNRVRIGFISKFFGIFEPHGLLLDGVMKYLPRSVFEVIALPVARTDLKPLAPSIKDAVDLVVEISLKHEHAIATLQDLHLDILVFADTLSEPLTHFLTHSRIARIQIAFWGNPITTASRQIDFFISGEFLEHPYRTRMFRSDEPYSEQVVLLEGQGVWYYQPEDPAVTLKNSNVNITLTAGSYHRNFFGFHDDWFIYFCPQSVFKMHPLFDSIFQEVLLRNNRAHIVVTGGRRQRWTDVYANRLRRAFSDDNLFGRIHFISRVSSEKFVSLLRLADAVLHPFPFDGSRTSADALVAGVPYVSMPTEYLRGRMGASFMRTMNIPELVARNRSEYIDIAAKLCNDRTFLNAVRQKIRKNVELIWEDMEHPYSWTRFLSLISGHSQFTWQEFLRQSGRDIVLENTFRRKRKQNQIAFDQQWGQERWLLDGGIAKLESHVDRSQIPRVFNNWKKLNSEILYSQPSRVDAQDLKMQSRQLIKDLVLSGNLSGALALAKSIPEQIEFETDGSSFLDLGAIYFFLGEYESAFHACSQAVRKSPFSIGAQTCIGVSAMYLNKEEESIAALSLAKQLIKMERYVSDSLIFVVGAPAAEFNLLTALHTFKQYEVCVAVGLSDISNLPSVLSGVYSIIFALVDWSVESYHNLLQLEISLKQRTPSVHFGSLSFHDQIIRIQRSFQHILNPLSGCILNGFDDESLRLVLSDLMEVVSLVSLPLPHEDVSKSAHLSYQSTANFFSHNLCKSAGVVLVTQHYATEDSQTAKDLHYVLQQNLDNPSISAIILLNEVSFNYSNMKNSWKISQILLNQRITFQQAFSYANVHLSGCTVILANADIYFDETLFRLKATLFPNDTVLALLKWTYKIGSGKSLSLRTNSQDAWIFKSPMNSCVVDQSMFFMGAVRCDNRLAKIFADCGYKLLNPVFAIHAIEVHSSSRQGSLYGTKNQIIGSIQDVLLSDKHMFG